MEMYLEKISFLCKGAGRSRQALTDFLNVQGAACWNDAPGGRETPARADSWAAEGNWLTRDFLPGHAEARR